MAIIKGAVSGALWEIDSASRAGRAQLRPDDVGSLGSYQLATTSGTMAAGLAAGATIFSCRWGDSTRAMLLRRIAFMARCLGTAFTAGATTFDLVVARAFTASDTGGVSILPTGNSQKMRTSFGTTLITDLRRSDTAALTAGTRTLDTHPLSILRGFVPATQVQYPMVGDPVAPGASTLAFNVRPVPLFDASSGLRWPLVLVQNEGFIIRATVPATGTWDFTVELEWSEIATTGGYN